MSFAFTPAPTAASSSARSKRGRHSDDEDEEEKDTSFSSSVVQASKKSHSSHVTSRDFFMAILEWADDANAASKGDWNKYNDEFVMCGAHSRLSDMYSKPADGSCTVCGYSLDGAAAAVAAPSISEHSAHHERTYPMLVSYSAADGDAVRRNIKALYDASVDETVRARVAILSDDRRKPTQEELTRLMTKNHRIGIAYKRYAWHVADTIRENWKRDGVLTNSPISATLRPAYRSAAPGATMVDDSSEFPPHAFLAAFRMDMMASKQQGSANSMWCFKHNQLGEWLMGPTPGRYDDCGFCVKARPLRASEIAYNRKNVYSAL
jgi:hypothetical protein